MKPIYEVLYRGDINGKIVGRHIIFWEDNGRPGIPSPLAADSLASIESTISGAIVTENADITAKLATQAESAKVDSKAKDAALADSFGKLDALKQAHIAALDGIVAAVQDEATPTAAVLDLVAKAKEEVLKDETQKKRDAISAQIFRLQKQLDEIK